MAPRTPPKLTLLPSPSPAQKTAPDPVSGDSRGIPASRLNPRNDLDAIVEAAKARSKAALEAKIERLRAKERKKASLTSDASYRHQKSGAMRLEQVWRDHMAQHFPHVPQMAWFKRSATGKPAQARKEGVLIADLLDGYGDEVVVEEMLVSFVDKWESHFQTYLKQPTGSFPTVGFLYVCHASVMAETIRLRGLNNAVAKYEEWKQANAHDAFAVPPPELEAAYKAATAQKGKKP